jgi:hypothetical protein
MTCGLLLWVIVLATHGTHTANAETIKDDLGTLTMLYGAVETPRVIKGGVTFSLSARDIEGTSTPQSTKSSGVRRLQGEKAVDFAGNLDRYARSGARYHFTIDAQAMSMEYLRPVFGDFYTLLFTVGQPHLGSRAIVFSGKSGVADDTRLLQSLEIRRIKNPLAIGLGRELDYAKRELGASSAQEIQVNVVWSRKLLDAIAGRIGEQLASRRVAPEKVREVLVEYVSSPGKSFDIRLLTFR